MTNYRFVVADFKLFKLKHSLTSIREYLNEYEYKIWGKQPETDVSLWVYCT